MVVKTLLNRLYDLTKVSKIHAQEFREMKTQWTMQNWTKISLKSFLFNGPNDHLVALKIHGQGYFVICLKSCEPWIYSSIMNS